MIYRVGVVVLKMCYFFLFLYAVIITSCGKAAGKRMGDVTEEGPLNFFLRGNHGLSFI